MASPTTTMSILFRRPRNLTAHSQNDFVRIGNKVRHDRAGHFQGVPVSMPTHACLDVKRCHVRLKAQVQGLEDNIQRHMNSPVMQDPFLCSTLCDFNLSQSKRRRQDQEQGGTWNVAQESVIVHLGSVLRNSPCVCLCSPTFRWTATPRILVTTAEYGRVSRTQLQVALLAL